MKSKFYSLGSISEEPRDETFMFRIIKDIFSYDHDYSGRVLTNLGLLSDCQEHCLGQHRWSEKIC